MTVATHRAVQGSPWPAALMFGAVCQIAQILLLREFLTAFHGSELSIGLVLGAWLVWVGIGSRLGAVLSDRTRRPLTWLALGAAIQAPLLPGTIVLVRMARLFSGAAPGALLSLPDMAWAALLLPAPVCLLFGAQFVWLSRVWREHDRAADTAGAGKTYACEAAGNMLGGMLFTFVLVHGLNPIRSAVLAGIAMLVAFLLAFRLRRTLWALPVLAVAMFPFLGVMDEGAHRLQWSRFLPHHRLIETRPSRHGIIAVAKQGDQVSFFQSGHLMFTAAGPDTPEPGLEEQEAAVMAHVAMTQHARPRRVLLIGGGLRGTLGEMVKHPIERIDYVELDRTLTETARPYLPRTTQETLADPRVRLIHADGRLFVKTTRETYDLIVVDAPEPATAALNRFYTREFFAEAKARLNPDGALVIGAVSTPDLRGLAIAHRNATLYHTLRSVFPRVLVGGQRFMIFAGQRSHGTLSLDPAELRKRYRERGIESAGFSDRQFEVLLREPQLSRVNWMVRHHGRSADAHLNVPLAPPLAPGSIADIERAEAAWPSVVSRRFVNTDFKPIAVYYTLMFWDDLASGGRTVLLRSLLRVQSAWVLPPLGLALAVAWVLRLRARRSGRHDASRRFAVLFAVFTTGLSTMALHMALIFAFQGVYGFVYEMIGLIVAVFMGGLALGALAVQRGVADKTNVRTLAAVQGVIALLAVLLAAALPRVAMTPAPALVFVVFFGLTFMAGLINGVDFPLATACCLALNRPAEKSTAVVYGMELFGACLGAVLAGVIVAPILGIVACCLLAAAVNGTACIVLEISRRGAR